MRDQSNERDRRMLVAMQQRPAGGNQPTYPFSAPRHEIAEKTVRKHKLR